MKMNPLLLAALAASCGLTSGAAHAGATSWDPSWAFSGFGTLGYVKTNTDAGLYAGPGQPGGASKDGTAAVDSKLGLQVNAKANNVFSGTVQAISERNGDGNFKPAIEWAFLKAQVTPDLGIRVGRIGAPLFMVSDFRSIGYSNLWLRTPLEVYGQVPYSHFDGADAIYQGTIGSTTLTGQLFVGKSNDTSATVDVHIKKQIGLNVTAEFDNGLTVRLGTAHGKLTVDNASATALAATLRQTPFAAVGNQLDANDKDAWFSGIGVGYDHENWVANFEYTKRKTSSFVSSTTGWEATLGYRVGKFTPYAVVSQLKVDSSNIKNTIPTNAGVQLATLAAYVNALIARQNLAQKTDAVGVRWDVWKNIALKAQYDRVKVDGGVGLFTRVTGTMPSSVNVYSIAADFVF
jgi:hypothetical protein